MKILIFLLLAPLAIFGQPITIDAFSDSSRDTFLYNYVIQTDGADQLTEFEGMLIFGEDFVFVQFPDRQLIRTVTGSDRSKGGEKILTFANGEGLRIGTSGFGSVNGLFLSSRGQSFFFGYDWTLADRVGWTNKTERN